MDDRLSSLSDDVLAHILSFLDTKSAVQTSILSSRWKYLHTFATSLNFGFRIPLSSYRNDVNRVVMQHKTNIKKFTLSMPFYLGDMDGSLVKSWIAVAVSRGVEELKLCIGFNYDNWAPAGCLFICQTLVVFNLSAGGTILRIPSLVWLPSLKILHMKAITLLDSSSMTRLFNGCPLLEDLCLDSCMWEVGQVYTIPAPMLRRLRIETTYDYPIKIEFDVPRLKCFEFVGVVTELYCIKSATALAIVDIDIDDDDMGSDGILSLIRGLSNATTVKLSLSQRYYWESHPDYVDYCSYHCYRLHDQLPVFSNLSHLEVSLGERRSGVFSTILQHLLSKSPKLETLVFRQGFRHCYCHLREMVLCQPFTWSSQVNVIQVNNFSGTTKESWLVLGLASPPTLFTSIHQNPDPITRSHNSGAALSSPEFTAQISSFSAMISTGKLKSVDFYRKIPRDLTEASLSGAGLSIVAALSMVFLFGMELRNYLAVSTTTSVVVDRSSDRDFLRMEFNISFPALSCEFASVDVSDILGTNRLNITKTIRKFSIDSNLRPTGSEFHSGPAANSIKHDDDSSEERVEGSVELNARDFDRVGHEHDILVVNFYAPWCPWCNRLKPSWEKAAKIMREKYDPETDGRILLGKVDCTVEGDLCRRHHIQGYPSIRIFKKGSDLRNDDHGHHDHESYYGDRDTDSLVKFMEGLVAPIPITGHGLALEDKSANSTENVKRPAPVTGGCRIEGFVRVKKVPGNLIITAHSGSHSFDASRINVSHFISHLTFGKKITPRVMSDVKRILPYIGASHERLNGQTYITQHETSEANVTIEHYLQIVKTEVVTGKPNHEHTLVEEYEYTAHSSLIQSLDIPAAKFHFELSPMQVLVKENSKSFAHFITNVCAIIGGVFTVAGILDSILHNTMRMVKKVELGKQF
ncbi:Protein disulfide-isomerase 5-4 [Dionaea muscipula]